MDTCVYVCVCSVMILKLKFQEEYPVLSGCGWSRRRKQQRQFCLSEAQRKLTERLVISNIYRGQAVRRCPAEQSLGSQQFSAPCC